MGGGIAGVVCAETLCELLTPSAYGLRYDEGDNDGKPRKKVALISASKSLKTTVNVKHITQNCESFDITETESNTWSLSWPDILTVLTDAVIKLE